MTGRAAAAAAGCFFGPESPDFESGIQVNLESLVTVVMSESVVLALTRHGQRTVSVETSDCS